MIFNILFSTGLCVLWPKCFVFKNVLYNALIIQMYKKVKLSKPAEK